MNFIIDFYNDLDFLNTIIFWGVIIVIILLLVFAIVISNKNKKLKMLLAKKEINKKNEEENEQLPIIKNNTSVNEEPKNISNELQQDKNIQQDNIEEANFIVEEYIPNPTKKSINIEPIIERKTTREIPDINKAYQKNVLREMSLNQTSPIGIVKNNNNLTQEQNKKEELTSNSQNNVNQKPNINPDINSNSEKKANQTYIEEVAQKLSSASTTNDIERTEYEIQQEEEAIISYEELMQKKDTIKIVDEEEAVISIEELIQKKKMEEEKLYKITKEADNENFISELKSFRKGL